MASPTEPLRVREQLDAAPVPAGAKAPDVVDVVVRMFGPELLARCRQRDQEVTRG